MTTLHRSYFIPIRALIFYGIMRGFQIVMAQNPAHDLFSIGNFLCCVTPFRPNSLFVWVTSFHRTFVTDVPCRKGTLTPPDTWSRPIWDLHIFFLLKPIFFPDLSLFFRSVHLEQQSVLSRICLPLRRIISSGCGKIVLLKV